MSEEKGVYFLALIDVYFLELINFQPVASIATISTFCYDLQGDMCASFFLLHLLLDCVLLFEF